MMIIAIALLSINCNIHHPVKINYIEIKWVGPEQHPIKTIFISNKEVIIKIDGRSVEINNEKPQLLTDADQMKLSAGLYSVLIIDNNTFEKVSAFIDQHHEFFTNCTKKNFDDIIYSIISKGKIYNISYKQKDGFFSNLFGFLKAKNCDKGSIKTLTSYLPPC